MTDGPATLPPLNGLRVFEVASRHLNFRLAAEELGVTQAAVAQQVRALEANLGIKLFERLPRGLRLTDAGLGYSRTLRNAFALISEATSALRPGNSHLTVSVTPTFASKWLIPRLASFTEAHGEIDLRVLATDRLSQFHADGVDLAVRYGQPPFGPGLNTERLLEQRVVAVASPTLLAQRGRPQNLEQLQHFLLLHDAHNFWPEFIAGLFGQPAQPMPKNVRFNQTSLAIEAAIAGQGLALSSHFFVQSDLEAGRLALVFDHALHLDKHFYLVWPRKGGMPAALETVRQWLLRQAR
ncbi:LysR substrate-binding domain-containing protein [Pseudomonas guariconensis]|uniref:LysR substrate-binding domain-containing protein n=1 Tax=Pseudomonas TaxID=286 RepID=UPI002097DE5A|nr:MULTISPECIES: LysR substrate-binding domain-containing protein [Pseudomonas]MCO7637658.1 LysR substrate-binding domain-containing protein [Pseudomonas sp. S 311-6]MCO7517163.1 LysR substrate-binding domain-containing protein [Pseudomonas putida]MCO7567114.1 LysR substrate-binding domain-containing protein [Pseudomonas mosselii]MCO7607748.1 LysR substrate-binding domain-containing protein [Pseudomonas guariconensis]MCO7618673.1 LysR substrate-binding domain-containing protein [Pseudomonas gu